MPLCHPTLPRQPSPIPLARNFSTAAAAREKETLHLCTFDDALPSLIARWLIGRTANPQQQALMLFAHVQAHLGRPEQFLSQKQ